MIRGSHGKSRSRLSLPPSQTMRTISADSNKKRAPQALNHPNIIAVYDVGVHDGAPYLVTELLEGATCAIVCERDRSRPAKRWNARCK